MFTVDAKELKTAILAVARSRASGKDARVALTGMHCTLSAGTLELAAADGFRLSIAKVGVTGHEYGVATLDGAALVKLARSLKTGTLGVHVQPGSWTFGASNVPALTGCEFPDYAKIVPDVLFARKISLDAPAMVNAIKPLCSGRGNASARLHLYAGADDGLAITASDTDYASYGRWLNFHDLNVAHAVTLNPRYLLDAIKDARGTVALYVNDASEAVLVSYGYVDTIIMPMAFPVDMLPAVPDAPSAVGYDDAPRVTEPPAAPVVAWLNDAERAIVAEHRGPSMADALEQAQSVLARVEAVAHHAEMQDAADARYDEMIHASARVHDKREARRMAAAAGACPMCGTLAERGDKFCAECGHRLAYNAAPATSAAHVYDPTAPSAEELYGEPDTARPFTSKYSPRNAAMILAQCPQATDVRGFHDWLKAGRAVQKGQRGIQIIVPIKRRLDEHGIERVVTIKPGYVFDISQTAPATPRPPRPTANAAPQSYAAAD